MVSGVVNRDARANGAASPWCTWVPGRWAGGLILAAEHMPGEKLEAATA